MTSGLWILIATSAILVFWVVGAYNRLVRLKNAIGAAFGQLDEQLRRRHELIVRLMTLVEGPLSQERGALEALAACTAWLTSACGLYWGAPSSVLSSGMSAKASCNRARTGGLGARVAISFTSAAVSPAWRKAWKTKACTPGRKVFGTCGKTSESERPLCTASRHCAAGTSCCDSAGACVLWCEEMDGFMAAPPAAPAGRSQTPAPAPR